MSAFPSTRISAVSESSSTDTLVRERGFAKLVEAYWKAIYFYVRIKHNKNHEDAEDVTQGFLTSAWNKGTFAHYDSSKSRFRTYVRICVDRFVINQYEARTRLKRGGGYYHLSLDFIAAETEFPHVEKNYDDPERCFEREWMRGLIQDSVIELHEVLAQKGKQLVFDVFEAYDLGDDRGEEMSYKVLASRFHIPTSTVTNYLADARRELRRLILSRLRQLTPTNEELQEDFRIALGLSPET